MVAIQKAPYQQWWTECEAELWAERPTDFRPRGLRTSGFAQTRLEPQLSQLERLRQKRGIPSGLKADKTLSGLSV